MVPEMPTADYFGVRRVRPHSLGGECVSAGAGLPRMRDLPFISVVIPTYNRLVFLRKCLTALANQDIGNDSFEVIVCDDGSTDGTQQFLEAGSHAYGFATRWCHHSQRGPAAARNQGLSLSRGEVIAFTDDDCVPRPDWLRQLIAGLPNDVQCAGVGGPVQRITESRIGRFIDAAGLMSHWAEDGVVQYLITANALYRRSCLEVVGGFDESFPLAGGEDADLSLRLRRLGFFLSIESRAVVGHHHHATLRGFCRMSWRHGYGAAIMARCGLGQSTRPPILSLAAGLLRAIAGPIPPGACNVQERLYWRVLAVVHRALKEIGRYQGRRVVLPPGRATKSLS